MTAAPAARVAGVQGAFLILFWLNGSLHLVWGSVLFSIYIKCLHIFLLT